VAEPESPCPPIALVLGVDLVDLDFDLDFALVLERSSTSPPLGYDISCFHERNQNVARRNVKSSQDNRCGEEWRGVVYPCSRTPTVSKVRHTEMEGRSTISLHVLPTPILILLDDHHW